jgi:hypothetical protein
MFSHGLKKRNGVARNLISIKQGYNNQSVVIYRHEMQLLVVLHLLEYYIAELKNALKYIQVLNMFV